MGKSRKKWFLIGGGGVVFAGIFLCCCAGSGVVWMLAPRDEVVFSNDGPDEWGVEVMHHTPGWLRQSPHTYDVYLVDKKSGKKADGTAGHLNLDSQELKGLMVGWIPGFCTMHEKDPGRHVFVGTLPTEKEPEQSWLIIEAEKEESK